MKLNKKTGFWGRSLLWSLLLYVCCTLVLDWKEVTSLFQKEDNAVIVQAATPIEKAKGKAEIVVKTQKKTGAFISAIETIAEAVSKIVSK